MLHLIRSDVEGDGQDLDLRIASAVNDHSQNSTLDHIVQRVGTGFHRYRSIKQFIDADDVRYNDAIAISDRFTDAEVMQIVREYALGIPVLILTGDRSRCEERFVQTSAYANVEMVLAPVM